MRIKIFPSLLILLFNINLFAYQDYDIDGVDDSIDKCPNTSFDELVDKEGCASSQTKKTGMFTVKIGSDLAFDTLSDTASSVNIYAAYKYENYQFSLSNYSYLDNQNRAGSTIGDLYLSGSYKMYLPNSSAQFTLGSKLATGDEDISTGENDYFASLYYNYYIDNKTDLFAYYGYTLSGDSPAIDYENMHTFSIGSGYTINEKWYSALSYDHSDSIFPDNGAYQSLSWFNSYDISKRYFVTLNYSRGISDNAYNHLISLKFGVNFE